MRRLKPARCVGAILVLASTASPVIAQCIIHEDAKLVAADGASDNYFGLSVALSGDTALIGAHQDDDGGLNSGSVYVFRTINGSWQQIAKLTADDAQANDRFGFCVALSGDTAFVGAHENHEVGTHSGSVYIFRDVGGVWQQVAEIVGDDTEALDHFGNSVAVDGDTAIIGASFDPEAGPASGSAYVFRETSGNWNQLAKLIPDDAAESDQFGRSVAISGDTAVVGAFFDDDAGADSGSAYVFREVGPGTSGWQQVAKLTAADAAADDWFGLSVAISGGDILVGAHRDDDAGFDSGSAYVFREIGGVWQQVAKLSAADAAEDDQFGLSVSMSGSTAIIGAQGDDRYTGIRPPPSATNLGAAYVFRETSGVWTQVMKLTASDAGGGDGLGWSVAVSGNTAIASTEESLGGAHSGSAYIFDVVLEPIDCNTNGTPDECDLVAIGDCNTNSIPDDCDIAAGTSLDCNATGTPDDCELASGARDDCNSNGTPDDCDIAAATSPDCNTNSIPDECDLANPLPVQIAKLTAAGAAADDQFSVSLDLFGDTAIIGANLDDDACPADPDCNSGSAYVFRRFPGAWQQLAKLTADDGAAGDEFGCSVAIHGNTAIVGARFDDDAGSSSGSAYIFRESGGAWQQIVKLTAPDGAANDSFGFRVDLWQDTAIVGAPLDDGSGTDSGSAYVFREIEGTWEYVAKLTALDASVDDNFGWSVSISGATAVVGAHQDDDVGINSGSAYVFRELDGAWQQIDKLVAGDGAALARFGVSAALKGDTTVIGALLGGDDESGSAYVFREVEGVWQQQAELVPMDAGTGDNFGISVALHADTALVGAWQSTDTLSWTGAAYAFREIDDTWSQVVKLTAVDAGLGDRFGYSVAYDGGSALVGAIWDDHAGADSGSAYFINLFIETRDCNANIIPDECDIIAGTSIDCNVNAIPDECEPDFDADGVIDDCDGDMDNDGVSNELDACNYTPSSAPPGMIESDGTLLGDFDGDCDVDAADHAEFASCMAGPGVPLDAPCAAIDVDGDSDADLADAALVQQRFTGSNAQ